MRFFRSKYVVTGLALILAVGFSGCGKKKTPPTSASTAAGQPAGPTIDPKAMAVSVDGHMITWGDVLGEMRRLQPVTAGQVTAQQAAHGLIMRQLLRQAADKSTLIVTTQELAAAITQVRRQVPTHTTLEAMLSSKGITEATFRADIIGTIKVNQLLKQLSSKAPRATDVEINQYVKENPALLNIPESASAHVILIATKPADDAAARKAKKNRAGSLRKQLLSGADFAKLASTASDDPSHARGGELPVIQRGVLPDKIFEAAVFSQKVGEIGPVLDTRYGYVILQVQQRTPAKVLKLNEVKEKVRALVTEKKYEQVVQDYLNDLRAKAKIVYAQSK